MKIYFATLKEYETLFEPSQVILPVKTGKISSFYPIEDLYEQNYKDAEVYSFHLDDHYPINLKIAAYCWHPHWKPYSISSEEAIKRIYEIMKEADRKERNKIIEEIRSKTRNTIDCNYFIEKKFKTRDEELNEALTKIEF
jgi:hypothetical protein